MSLVQAEALPRWKSVPILSVKVLLAAAFLTAGGLKLYGLPIMVENFTYIGFGQWFRYLTGTLEVLGGTIILIPSLSAFGALLLSCIMIGAIAIHLFLIGGSPFPAAVLLFLCATIFVVQFRQIRSVVSFVSRLDRDEF
jgi:putative oxidoreductase